MIFVELFYWETKVLAICVELQAFAIFHCVCPPLDAFMNGEIMLHRMCNYMAPVY